MVFYDQLGSGASTHLLDPELHVVGTLRDWSSRERLGDIHEPALVISGSHDEATPAPQGPLVRELGGPTEQALLPASSHVRRGRLPPPSRPIAMSSEGWPAALEVSPPPMPPYAPPVRPRTGYVPELDGFRALAVLLVLQHHIGVPHVTGGFIGVSLFFVLSGFLITGLLLDELGRTGAIGVRRFYGRRARRLYPALLLAVGLAVVLSEATGSFVPQTRHGAPLALIYGLDVDAWTSVAGGGLVSHMWSLAIEAQFYLVWPFIVLWCWRSKRFGTLSVALGGVGACFALSLANAALTGRAWYPGTNVTYYFPLFSGVPLLLGAALAAAVRSGRGARALDRPGLTAVAVVVLLVAVVRAEPNGALMVALGFPAIFLATAALLGTAYLRPDGGIGRVLRQRWLVWIGVRSYGIYLFHYPYALAFRSEELLTRLLLVTLCSVLTAAASWRFVEQPLLRGGGGVGVRGREEAVAAAG